MTDRSPVAAVILAAGPGRRFGGPKALATLDGTSFLERCVDLARHVGLDPVVAVLPPGIDGPEGVVAVVNPDPERGLSSSLQLGIEGVPDDHAALILLVDQPTLEPSALHAVLAGRGPAPIVAARADGRLAPPVLLEPEGFRLVSALRGDIGLREVVAAHPDLVAAIEVPAHAPDVDTPEDLERLRAGG